MDTREVIVRLEADIATLRRQNERVRACLCAVAVVAVVPWLIAAAGQTAKPSSLSADRLHLDGPNGGITLRSIEAMSAIPGGTSRPEPALGIFGGMGDALSVAVVAGSAGAELRVGDRGGVRLTGGAPARGRVEVQNEEAKTGAELLAAPGGGGSVVIRGPSGAGVGVLETATDGSGQLEVRDAAGRIIQRLP
jgi:hypothetical protein